MADRLRPLAGAVILHAPLGHHIRGDQCSTQLPFLQPVQAFAGIAGPNSGEAVLEQVEAQLEFVAVLALAGDLLGHVEARIEASLSAGVLTHGSHDQVGLGDGAFCRVIRLQLLQLAEVDVQRFVAGTVERAAGLGRGGSGVADATLEQLALRFLVDLIGTRHQLAQHVFAAEQHGL